MCHEASLPRRKKRGRMKDMYRVLHDGHRINSCMLVAGSLCFRRTDTGHMVAERLSAAL